MNRNEPGQPAVLISKPTGLKAVSVGPFEKMDAAEWWARMLRLEAVGAGVDDAFTIVTGLDTYAGGKSSLGAFWIDPASLPDDPAVVAEHLRASPPGNGDVKENFPNVWTLLVIKYGIAHARAVWDAACDINGQNPYFSAANNTAQPNATDPAESPRLAEATTLLTRFMRTAWQAAGLTWGADEDAELGKLIRLIMDEVDQEIDAAFTGHMEDAPHIYPDGSTA